MSRYKSQGKWYKKLLLIVLSLTGSKYVTYCVSCMYWDFCVNYPRDNRYRDGRATRCEDCYTTHVQVLQETLPARRVSTDTKQYNVPENGRWLMLVDQEYSCAVCSCAIDLESSKIDHNHACCSGKKSCGKCVRALLCSHCNLGLGHFKDSSYLLNLAAQYLQDHELDSVK